MENIYLNNQTKKTNKYRDWSLTPTQVLALSFFCLILFGALLLSLPMATVDGKGAPPITALFTATSAACVTGLVVVDTGTYFTVFGQMVILLLIQIGGLGFMTFATLFAILLGRKITLKERMLLQESFNQVSIEGIVRLVKYVIQMTFIIETLGAVILALRWAPEFGWRRSIYLGIFHSVSSFNNAGFDLFGGFRSITMYVGDLTVNLVIASLIILGGLGFHVLSDIYVKRGRHLRLHSQLVIYSSLGLIVVGAVIIFLLEYTNPNTLGGLNPLSKIIASFFQSVSPRTAGYNSLPIGEFRDTTLLFIIILMFIGASPGSTGGGIKTTTFVALYLTVIAVFKGRKAVCIRERTLPPDLILRAMTITISSMILIIFHDRLFKLNRGA